MIAAKSCDFHSFCLYKNFLVLCEKKYYNFRAICGIPIIPTGLNRLIRICYSYSGFTLCIFVCKNRTYRLLTLQAKTLSRRDLHSFKLENQLISSTDLID